MAKKMLKLLSAALAFAAAAINLVYPVSADGYIASLLDISNMLTFDEECDVRQYLNKAAKEINCNIGVLILEEPHNETAREYAQRQMENVFGANSDTIMLVLCSDSDSGHCIITDGDGDKLLPSAIDKDLAMVDILAAKNTGGYPSACTAFANELKSKAGVSADGEQIANPDISDLKWSALIEDCDDAVSEKDEEELITLIKYAAANAECNIGIIIDDTLEGKQPGQVADDYLDANFGANSDSIVLLLTTDPDGFDYITFSNNADTKYGDEKDAIFDEVYSGLSHGGYTEAIKSFCGFFGVYTGNEEKSDFLVKLVDEDDCLTDYEEDILLDEMQATANEIECHVGVVITADLGGKSESSYADDFADDSFGYGSDNVVLLLCNDHVHTDWISAYGRGTSLFGDRTDDIFDAVYDGLDSGSNGDDYKKAIDGFCTALNKYGANAGDIYYDYEDDYVYHKTETVIESVFYYIFSWRGVVTVIALVFAIINTKATVRKYSKKAPVSAKHYMEADRTNIYARMDNFVREYTTSYRISSSSGGGHGGGHRSGGGGRSRGGRSGGGGRRR